MSEKATSSFISTAVTMEPLEPRTLLSLLGVAALIEAPDVNYNSTGVVNYSATTTVFESTATPTTFVMTKGARPINVQAPRMFHLKIQVDNNGNFLGGFANDDLRIEGQVDLNNDGIMDFDGVLLTARATAFGFLNGASTDQYDFRLIPTGGDLLPYFAGKDIGMTMSSLNSTFANNFGVDFNGRAQGIVGPISALYGSLAGSVYSDGNDNGVNDGDSGVQGTSVNLTGSDVTGAPVSQTATTGVNGSYSFGQLRPGTYVISEVQPAGLLDGTNAVGSAGGVVSGDTIGSIALGLGQNATGYTFGEIAPASLGGAVTSNGNALAGVTITLTGNDDLGAINRTLTTGADGSFAFDNLRPGTYAIGETQPAGLLDGSDAAGSLGGVVGNDSVTQIAVAQGQSGAGYSFTEIAPASLSGSVTSGSNALTGVTITLTGNDDLGAVSRTITTGADGSFVFDNLRPGTYAISETQPAGLLDGSDAAGSLGGMVGDDSVTQIAVAQGQSGAGYAFTEITPASLSGAATSNGTGIAGVTITLTGNDDLGAVSRTVVTGANGTFTFAGLRPGTYALAETQPAGLLDGSDAAGSLGGVVGNDSVTQIAVAQGQSGAGYAFTEVAASSVSGGVYFGSLGIAGVTITLTGTNDLGAAVSMTTATGTSGSFSFAGLRPGTYALAEAQPAGYIDGNDVAGNLGGVVADDFISQIVVGQGKTGTGYAFNEIEGGSISGLVWEDFNNDGEVDFGESAIAGVTIQLTGTDDRGNAVSRTVVTDEDGMYLFGGLRPSSASGYTIHEVQPSGWDDGMDVIGTVNGVAVGSAVANDKIGGIKLQAGADAINYNFGELVDSGGRVIGSGQTATIGFWQNKNGQAMIKALNGGPNATQLGNWLAATYSNLYGNLAGKTNAQVAQYYLDIFKGGKSSGCLGPAKLDAQIMAVALATYATNSSLAGTTAVKYGFKVDEYGVGIRTINVGLAGCAFGVDCFSVQTVLDLLWATDTRSTDGRIYDMDGNGKTNVEELLMQTLANALYTVINELGHISC